MEVIKETLENGVYVRRKPRNGEAFKITIYNDSGVITHVAKGTHNEPLQDDSAITADDGGHVDE